MRISWKDRVAQQLQVEEARRNTAARQQRVHNGTGCVDVTQFHLEDEKTLLPVRIDGAMRKVSLAPPNVGIVTNEGAAVVANDVQPIAKVRSTATKSDDFMRGMKSDEIAEWQRSLAAPTPTSSPGAMKDAARQSTLPLSHPKKVTLSKCSEAPSTKIEEWMNDDQAVLREDSSEDEDEEHLPVRGNSNSANKAIVDEHYLPIRYRTVTQVSALTMDELADGGEIVVAIVDPHHQHRSATFAKRPALETAHDDDNEFDEADFVQVEEETKMASRQLRQFHFVTKV